MKIFYDSVGNELKPGDIIRMFHFVGARKRKHYMYKKFIGYETYNKVTIGIFNHLDGDGGFRSRDNEYQNKIVVVQRAKYEQANLRRSKILRD